MKRTLLSLLVCLMMIGPLFAQEAVNEEINIALRKQGLEHSQVMDIASWMTDVYGPRLTGSPKLDKATEWAVKTLKEWGMENVHTESWGPFGRGWQLDHFEIHANAPGYFPVLASVRAWSPSIKGKAEVVYLNVNNEEELQNYKGKLKGKFVFIDTIRVVEKPFEGRAKRFNSEQLLEKANAATPAPRVFRNFRFNSFKYSEALWSFLESEQPIAVIERSYKGDLGTIFASRAMVSDGKPWEEGKTPVPQLTMSVEHYNRLFRLMTKDIPVELSIDLQTSYHNPDGMEHNIIAEIPGTDLKEEVVMFGAHFDSWHTGTGATDNAAGSAVMMEAARIILETIKETGIRPRRTLRLALWTGEEQGLYGSKGYVKNHFAETDPFGNPLSLKPAQEKISAYYNMDNGTGKVRGVYMQGNAMVAPIFRAWLDEFKDLEATTLTLSNTGGTDHLAFDRVGIPGFQFIQDPIAYSTRTHHSNMDNWDHLIEDDLKQAATVIASFVFHTAQRDEKLPRKTLELKIEEEQEGGRK